MAKIAKATWSGTIGFGMVSIPIKVYKAAASEDTTFVEISKATGNRCGRQTIDKGTGTVLTPADIDKGFEVAKNQYVVLTEADLKRLPLPSKESIRIQAFVPVAAVDPVYYEASYYLGADDGGAHALALLLRSMEAKQVIAIGTIAMRKRESLCALRVVGGAVIMHLMYRSSEVRVELDEQLPEVKPSELQLGTMLIESLMQPFDPNPPDVYEAAVQQLIADLQAGTVTTPNAPVAAPVNNLEALLKASLGVAA